MGKILREPGAVTELAKAFQVTPQTVSLALNGVTQSGSGNGRWIWA